MDETRRRNIRIALTIIIMVTIPFYCIGFGLFLFAPQGGGSRVTPVTATPGITATQPNTGSPTIPVTEIVPTQGGDGGFTQVAPPTVIVPTFEQPFFPTWTPFIPPPVFPTWTPFIPPPAAPTWTPFIPPPAAPTWTPFVPPTLTPLPLPTATTIPFFPTDTPAS